MKRNKQNSEHYYWGQQCSGWHLVKSKHLSIIQEHMPPATQEQKHYHHFAEQFFFILGGVASFQIEEEWIEVEQGEGIHILPEIKHLIKNKREKDLEFLVISQPSTRGDRVNETVEK